MHKLAARVMGLDLDANAAADVWGLVSELQYAADWDAAHAENRFLNLLADYDTAGQYVAV